MDMEDRSSQVRLECQTEKLGLYSGAPKQPRQGLKLGREEIGSKCQRSLETALEKKGGPTLGRA